MQGWEALLPFKRNKINVGGTFVGALQQNFYPRHIAINGQTCYVQQL
jgi:hypothetical protein